MAANATFTANLPLDKGDTIQLKRQQKDGTWEVVVNGLRTATMLIIENPGPGLNIDEIRARSQSTSTTNFQHTSSLTVKESSLSADKPTLRRVMSGDLSINPKSPRTAKEKRSKDKDKKDKEKSKAKLTDNLSESTLKLLVSPRSPRITHPRDLSEEEKAEIKEEIADIRGELQSLQIELNLLIRGWREEFNVSDTQKVDPRLTLKQSPDEQMFERLLSSPYIPLNRPPTIPAAALQSLKTVSPSKSTTLPEEKKEEKEVDKKEDEKGDKTDKTDKTDKSDKKDDKSEKKYRDPTKKHKNDKKSDSSASSSRRDKEDESAKKEEKVEPNEIALAPRRKLRVVELLLPEFNLNAVAEEHLSKLDSLQFNVLGLQSQIENEDQCEHYCYLLVMHMFHRLDLVREFAIPETALFRFVKTIARRYRNVPFHNFYHAFNVTQTMFYFLTTAKCDRMLGPLEKLSMLIATLCHDADHPGLNNGCLNQAQTKVAALHKKSTLENHHLLQGMQVLSLPECDILVNLSDEDIDKLQHYLRDLVLATDLSLHGIILRDMEARTKKLAKEWKKDRPKLDEGDLITLMCVIMKCSDLSNEIRPREIANIWAQRINKEFFAQADKERQLNLKVSAWMDYTKIVLAKEQINFISGLCMPLYRALLGVVPTVKVCVDTMENNKREWETRLKNFYSIEQQNNTSDRSIWKEDEEKGTSFLATVARRVTGTARIVRTSQANKK